MNSKIKDLTGNVYDRLTVIEFSHSKNNKTYWKCLCSCDADKPTSERAIHIICGKYLQDQSTSSCGCKRREHIRTVNNHSNKKSRTGKPYYSQLSNIWRTLINRCHNPNYNRYRFYGKKGVLVCNEWINNFDVFYDWAMCHGYREGLELNRLDQTRNYMPDNCEWFPKGFSAGNTSSNILVTIGNKTLSVAAWARDEECEVHYKTILKRYHKGIKGIALIRKEKPLKDTKIKFKKKFQSLNDWSVELNIPLNTLLTRYKRGDKGEMLFREIRK